MMRTKEYDIRNLIVHYKNFNPVIRKELSYHLTKVATFVMVPILVSVTGIHANNSSVDTLTQTVIDTSLSLSEHHDYDNNSSFLSSLAETVTMLPSVTFEKEVITNILTDSMTAISLEEQNSKEVSMDAFLDMPKITVQNENVYYRYAIPYCCSQEEYETICMIAFLEAGGITDDEKYIDAMAVTSVILNRMDDIEWSSLGGTALEQIYSPDQFATVAKLPNTSFSDVPEVVKNAVSACLGGIRNNNFVQFRAKNNKKPGRVQIVTAGNNYFDVMKEMEPSFMIN